MKQVFIIFQSIPDSVTFYHVQATDEQVKRLINANGKFINSMGLTEQDIDDLNFINNALSNNPDNCFEGDPAEYCIWKDTEVNLPFVKPIDLIITTGFIM